jgi:ketosteroid isomerase-like protein
MGLIGRVTRSVYTGGLRAVERGDLDRTLRLFHGEGRLRFVGDSPLGADLSGSADIRAWFERFLRLLPDPRFEVRRLAVSGPPWRQQLAAHVMIRSTVAGEPYQNQFAHFLTLRWGKIVDELVLEDTQTWAHACRRLVDAGVAEAAEPPLVPGAARSTHSTRSPAPDLPGQAAPTPVEPQR